MAPYAEAHSSDAHCIWHIERRLMRVSVSASVCASVSAYAHACASAFALKHQGERRAHGKEGMVTSVQQLQNVLNDNRTSSINDVPMACDRLQMIIQSARLGCDSMQGQPTCGTHIPRTVCPYSVAVKSSVVSSGLHMLSTQSLYAGNLQQDM